MPGTCKKKGKRNFLESVAYVAIFYFGPVAEVRFFGITLKIIKIALKLKFNFNQPTSGC